MKKESPKYSYCYKSHKHFEDSGYAPARSASSRSPHRYESLRQRRSPVACFSLYFIFSHKQNTFITEQQCKFLINPNRDFFPEVMRSIFLSNTSNCICCLLMGSHVCGLDGLPQQPGQLPVIISAHELSLGRERKTWGTT